MSIIFTSTIGSCVIFVLCLGFFYRIRQFAMNDAVRSATKTLFKGIIIILIGTVLAVMAWLVDDARYGLAASVINFTGVSVYFNTLRSLTKENKINYEKADLAMVSFWFAWLFLFASIIIHGILLWIY